MGRNSVLLVLLFVFGCCGSGTTRVYDLSEVGRQPVYPGDLESFYSYLIKETGHPIKKLYCLGNRLPEFFIEQVLVSGGNQPTGEDKPVFLGPTGKCPNGNPIFLGNFLTGFGFSGHGTD